MASQGRQGFAFQPSVGKALGGMGPSPHAGAAGHLGWRPKPVLSRLVPAAWPLCLVFGALQHLWRRRPDLHLVGAGCLRAPWRELLLAAAGR